MYSTKVIESAIERYQKSSSLKLIRIPAPKVEDWVHHLEERLKKFAGDTEELKKNLTKEENAFIRNERVMSMVDFSYWAARYGWMERDGGNLCKFTNPWGSQRILLKFIAKIEEDMHDQIARGEAVSQMMPDQPLPAVNGIMVALHKARQLGATAIGRLLLMHRTTLQNNRRALSASVNDDKIKVLYDRDKIVYDHLPWWLKPTLKYDEKCAHIHFGNSNSQMIYQVSSQKSGPDTAGIGVGRQSDFHHLTEVSSWNYADNLELDFIPTIPRSLSTLGLWESTAMGRGNFWHRFTEKVRHGLSPRFKYLFIPVYAEESKYRSIPPLDWKPSEVSMLYAQKVYETSHEFVGHAVMVTHEHLHWWETTRESARKDNKLHFFLTSYCATPEESFQHSNASAFPVELLDELRMRVRPGDPFDMIRCEASS